MPASPPPRAWAEPQARSDPREPSHHGGERVVERDDGLGFGRDGPRDPAVDGHALTACRASVARVVDPADTGAGRLHAGPRPADEIRVDEGREVDPGPGAGVVPEVE